MDPADPRTQPASQPQQPSHHHHAQQHHPQQQPQRQPQQPLNDQQQQPAPPQQQQQQQQQPQQSHHMPQQLTQPQTLHQQQQIAHPPQHAQPGQPTGYSIPQHYQVPLGYHQQTYTRGQFPYSGTMPAYSYPQFIPQAYQAWQQPASYQAGVPVSNSSLQGSATTTKMKPREKVVLQIKDPKTRQPIDLNGPEGSSKSSSDSKVNSTKANEINATTPTKSTATQQPKMAATSESATTTGTLATSAKPSASAPAQKPEPVADKSPSPVAPVITNNKAASSDSSARTGTSSPSISVSNILLQKVSEDTNSGKQEDSAKPAAAIPSSTLKTVAPTPAQTEKVVASEDSVNPVTTETPAINQDSKDVVKEDEKSKVTESAPAAGDVEKTDGEEKQDDKVVEECDEDSTKKGDVVNGETNLQYEKGQYNPTSNRDGKKKYSRQFMLDVCEKICKLDINSEVNSDNGGTAYNLDKTDMFAPDYHTAKYQSTNRQNDAARRQNPNNYTGRSSAGQERQRKIIVPSSSLTNEVELKTVSNPWRPGKEVKEEEVPIDVVEVEVLKKKFRSILNKLTPQNFDNLAIAVTDLHIDTEAKLGEVIDIVFAKALAEPGYCVLYGQMCSHLKKITAGQANFGNTLLKRCQNQFQADIYSGINVEERKKKIAEEQDAEAKKHLDEELYEDMFRCRMRGLGLIKFIGELYKIQMLIDAIMFDCINRLLVDPTSEESLECLCDLLKTIGEKLDRSSQANAKEKQRSQKNSSKTNAYQNSKSLASVVAGMQKAPEPVATLDPIFEQLHKIRKNKDLPLSVRIRFKLLDVCELREKDNWQSKSKDNNPKKLDEIKKDHLESERQKSMGPRKSQEGRRGLVHGGGSSSQISSLGNDSGANRTNFHSSVSSQSIRDHAYGEKMLQMNSDNHKIQEQHRQNISNMSDVVKKFSSNTGTNDKTDSLRPTPFRSTTLKPVSKPFLSATNSPNPVATAKSDTTNPTANSANTVGDGGGQS